MPMYAGTFRAHRKDKNHKAIVDELRWKGYQILEIHEVGKGCPDIIVSTPSDMWLVEIKSHGGSLTQPEKVFHSNWSGKPIITAYAVEDILDVIEN